jgi:hypothetical protein
MKRIALMSNKLEMSSDGDEGRENLERVKDSLDFDGMDEDNEDFEEERAKNFLYFEWY